MNVDTYIETLIGWLPEAMQTPAALAGTGLGLIAAAFLLGKLFAPSSKQLLKNEKDRASYQSLASTQIQLTGPDGVQSAQSLRERLLAADFGPKGIDHLIESLEADLSSKDFADGQKVLEAVRRYYRSVLSNVRPMEMGQGSPTVWLIAGVNGAGKTTTIAKLAGRFVKQNKKVVVGACDTFRAAASEQLEQWGERQGFRVVTGGDRTDPASVAFNAIESAKAQGEDLVILDTAGRLQADENLMRELEKIGRVAEKASGQPLDEVLLVLDVNQGQNLRSQMQKFGEVLPLSGFVFTKYDGQGRGGAAIDMLRETGLPVRFIGIGEGPEDYVDPDPDWIVERLFG